MSIVTSEHGMDSPNRFTSTRQRLIAEIEASGCHNFHLLEQLNTYTCISALPPELLVEIFACHAQNFRQTLLLYGRPYCQWIRITHVCRYWREAALGAPGLWNFIPIADPSLPRPEFIQAMVRRSKQKALELMIGPCYNRSPVVWNLLNSSPISSLDIEIEGNHTYATVLKGINPLPQLKFLRLVHRYVELSEKRSLSDPIPVLAASTPFLRHTEFHGPRLASCRIICRPTLRSLTLQGNPDLVPSMEDFLYALRDMPLVEEMTLSSVFLIIDNTSPSVDLITLPHLHSLALFDEPVSTSTYFLRSISTPSALQKLYLSSQEGVFTRTPTKSDFMHIIIEITKKLKGDPNSSSSKIPSLRGVWLENSNKVRIQAWRRSRSLSSDRSCTYLTGDVDLSIIICPLPIENIMDIVLDIFPLQDVRTCHVEYFSLPDLHFWHKLALRVPALHGIRVVNSRAATVFLEFLGEQHSFSDAVTYPFPQLRTIVLSDVDLPPRCKCPGLTV